MIARVLKLLAVVSAAEHRADHWRGAILGILGVAVAGAIIGALVVVSGIVPVHASSRHWPITEWFLEFSMSRSIATHSLGVKAPPLDDPDLIVKGATHYEIGCRSCHGSPGLPQPRIPHFMTPHPPYLPERIGDREPRELFHVVKHGVKFTGMPAWPTRHRDDEVWAVVAFLRKFPTLDEAAYRRLVMGDPPPTAPMDTLGTGGHAPHAAAQSCARCHGREHGDFPRLAGQHAAYIENALAAYARGDRHSGIMEPIAAALDAATVRELAGYYAAQPPAPSSQKNADALALGESIARDGIFPQRVPSCIDCHHPEGRRHKPEYPLLAGQPADYLVLQLELFEEGKRGGGPYAHLMHPIARRLKPEQRRAVAGYFQSLPPVKP